MSERNWSPQQQTIFQWFATGQVLVLAVWTVVRNLVCRARAGTGKTTTICHGVTLAPERRILVAAFNSTIRDELAVRLQAYAHIEVMTIHGLGFSFVRRFWEGIRVDKTGSRADRLTQEVCGDQAPDKVKRLVSKLHTKAREMAPLATTGAELLGIAMEHECVPDEEWDEMGFGVDYVCERAVQCMALAAATRPAEGIDFADMLFLPIRNKWVRPRYDLVVVDEAQDMVLSQLALVLGACTPEGRACVVGDDRQAIYGFRGADSGSLDRLKAELDAAELGLTVTYRCGSAIVDYAKRLVPDYQAAPGAKEGEIVRGRTIEQLADMAAPGEWVVSRTNAPLAKVAMALLRSQKRARVLGRDIGAGLKALLRKLATGKAANSIPAVLERLDAWEEREVERAERSGDKRAEALVEAIRDKAETLRVIMDGVTGVRELEARLDHLFSDDKDGSTSVTCSSVHKAKGKEAGTVYVLVDTLYPKRPGPKPGEPALPPSVIEARAREEANIEYVAVTRAIDRLVLVQGK